MRTVIFKLSDTKNGKVWYMVKLASYFDEKTKTLYREEIIWNNKALYDSANEGDEIKVV